MLRDGLLNEDRDIPAVCFVCLGNICRSPTGEGVMQHLLAERGLETQVLVDSAGTAAYHVGQHADARSRAHALARGVKLLSRARRFERDDFRRFDYVLAMDESNYQDLLASSRGEFDHKIFLFLDFDPQSCAGSNVPDPYYGGDGGFEHVLDLIFAGCTGLIDHLVAQHQLRSTL